MHTLDKGMSSEEYVLQQRLVNDLYSMYQDINFKVKDYLKYVITTTKSIPKTTEMDGPKSDVESPNDEEIVVVGVDPWTDIMSEAEVKDLCKNWKLLDGFELPQGE